MTTQLITPSPPAPSGAGPARHRGIRAAAAVAGVAAVIAAGGYFATTTIGPDAVSPTSASETVGNLSAQAQRELQHSIAGQYGSRPGAGTVGSLGAQARRELQQSIAGQYGPVH